MYKNSAVAEVTTCLEVADAAEPAAARGANVKNSLQGNVRARTASKASVLQSSEEEEVILATGMDDAADGQPEVQLRTNLNTLAFFVADLRTDATGSATYRFRVPELLTRWRIRGLVSPTTSKSAPSTRVSSPRSHSWCSPTSRASCVRATASC